MKKKKSIPRNLKAPDKDMMEAFNISPWYSVGKILPTSSKLKIDVFDSYRPHKKCVDYKISETWTKLQGGDVKINIRETSATYKEIPEEICKPKKRKKVRLFSGGPPQWKFIDELWRESMDQRQKIIKKEHREMLREAKRKRADYFEQEHRLVQRLIGPEWFMELSPSQLNTIDGLRESVYLDLRNHTTANCQDVLASLGLSLRPNQKKVAKALQHSCGCPVEFLLVLYQIIDPKRKSYSLNDRLLLSSVVHLSITQTLRELHIRIPSPPREVKTNEEKCKKADKNVKKKKKYKSPYLEPLTYDPPPPKHSGEYKNMHRQYPESRYFEYLSHFEQDKRLNNICINYSAKGRQAEIAEYQAARDFFNSLPGAKDQMLSLIPPSKLRLCPNLLHPRKKSPIRANRIPPNLCKVSASEPVICYCEENRQRENPKAKKFRRSCCEKNAQKFLQSLCLCDDCLENMVQKNLVRIHGGFLQAPCRCDAPIPLIQGTQLNRTCDCYTEYRNKIVGSAGRQKLMDQKSIYVVGGVMMTKMGPIYNVMTALGKKICICGELRLRKMQITHIKATLRSNKAKFVIGSLVITKLGPVYNLTSVVARAPCRCIIHYRKKLEILDIQNEIRKNRNSFVNNGLIQGHQGPVFYFSNVISQPDKDSLQINQVCSCVIKKPKCFERCLDFLEYRVSTHTPPSSSEEESESESEETSDSELLQNATDQLVCPYCAQNLVSGDKKTTAKRSCSHKQSPCQCLRRFKSDSSTDDSEESTYSSNDQESCSCQVKKTSSDNIDYEEFFAPKPCSCKDELDRFMKAKCPCEECNNKINRDIATYIMGGTKATPSGNQINLVQGVKQPLCGCLHEHQENIRKIDEYKSRIQARYNMKKQDKKYCISGVKNTSDGPVYIVSGLRPPVDCECAKAIREKEEQEEHERQRAKMPNTGRLKYEITGVKAMPEENIYILSRALKIPECECADLLERFEDAHHICISNLDSYLKLTEDERKTLDEEMSKLQEERTLLNSKEDENKSAALHELDHAPSLEEIKEESDFHSDPQEEPQYELPGKSDVNPTIQEEPQTELVKTSKKGECDPKCESTRESEYNSSDEEQSSTDDESSEYSSESDDSECGSCHVENPPTIKPITLPTDKTLPEMFLSKNYAIFKKFPQDHNTQMKILRHILEGMAEDGFPLAKLPQVYKLPIFKLWLQLRAGVYWTYEDKLKSYGKSKDRWKHTFVCYNPPTAKHMAFTKEQIQKMTWKHAKLIRRIAAEKTNSFYRQLKQVTVDTAREFFAPTYSYEFPTQNWRECAFAYLPAKELDVFPYKIVQPHEQQGIPDHQRMHCYC